MAQRRGDPVLERAGGHDHADIRADVVFVHGLGGGAIGTWRSDNDDTWWPRWVAEDRPHIAVWSLDYDAEPSEWLGRPMPIADRAGNILALLEAHDLGARPLFLVCHSLGGLLAKQMLHSAGCNRRLERIGNAVTGVVFLATPHTGSGITEYLSNLATIFCARPSDLAQELHDNSPTLRHLNYWFRSYVDLSELSVRSFFETHDTHGLRVVDQSSADPGLPGHPPIGIDSDHFGIAKPRTRQGLVYRSVLKFIDDVLIASARSSETLAGPPQSHIVENRQESRPGSESLQKIETAFVLLQNLCNHRKKIEAVARAMISSSMQIEIFNEIIKEVEQEALTLRDLEVICRKHVPELSSHYDLLRDTNRRMLDRIISGGRCGILGQGILTKQTCRISTIVIITSVLRMPKVALDFYVSQQGAIAET